MSYGDVSFEEAWGPLDKSQYNSVKFVEESRQIDSRYYKEIMCIMWWRKNFIKTSFYFTRNVVDYDLFVRNILLMTDI